MSTDLFDENENRPVIDPDKDYSADLVGEGKKFKDFAALARGKVESDEFIKSLQRELDGLRQELRSRTALEEIASRMGQIAPKNEEPQALVSQDNNTKQWTDEDLDELLERKLTAKEMANRRAENVRSVTTKLRETFGPGYVDVLKQKAAELGVENEFFNNLAADKPQALLKLVGAESTHTPRGNDLFAPPPTSHNTSFKPVNTERNQAYYNKIKKENPSLYWNKDTQVALHKDALRLGEGFFS